MIKSIPEIILVTSILAIGYQPAPVHAETLSEHFYNVRSEENVQPTVAELFKAEALFRRLLTGDSGPAIRREWAELGFELTGTRSERDPLLILQEFGDGATQNAYSGKGFFVISTNRDSKIVIQATHSFKDAESADIALQLMANSNILAAAWNTAPISERPHPTIPPQDSSKHRGNYITAFTKAIMTSLHESHVVQIHSFEPNSVHSDKGKKSDVILSGYGDQPNQSIGWLNRCLKDNLRYKINTFPLDVNEMGAAADTPGAADNSVGKLLASEKNHDFAHISLGSSFRQELKNYPDDREKTYSCFSRDAS
jgi:hypothetical protein